MSGTAAAAVTERGRVARLMRLATVASVSVAVTLVIVKAIAWWMTDSVGVLSTVVDSVLDAAASLVTLFAVRASLTPADAEHRFGHGKAEALSALFQASFIALSAVFVAVEAGRRLVEPLPVMAGEVGLAVMGVSVVLTAALVLFQRHVSRLSGSPAIRGDMAHYSADIVVNLGVAVGLYLSWAHGIVTADAIVGLVVALFILRGAYGLFRTALDDLMDREWPDADRDRAAAVALAHPEVRAIHDLRTRTSGRASFIQLHVELDGDMTLRRAQAISDAVEADLAAAFPQSEVIVHQDAYGTEPERHDRVRAAP